MPRKLVLQSSVKLKGAKDACYGKIVTSVFISSLNRSYAKAYHFIPVAPEDIEKTAICTEQVHFTLKMAVRSKIND